MNKLTVIGTINCLLGIINIVMFGLWMTMIKVESLPKPEEAKYYIDSVSTQLTILDLVITSVTVFLAIAGIIGYNTIKCGAELRAEETAKEVANQKMSEFLTSVQRNQMNQAQFSSQPTLGQVSLTPVNPQPITGGGAV